MLPLQQRLRKTGDFKAVYTRGRSHVHPMMVVYVLNRGAGEARIGCSISKKLGGATVRNRIKRLLREASRPLMARVKPGSDVVVVARSAINRSELAEIREVLRGQLTRAKAMID